jgi:hypothetical protein
VFDGKTVRLHTSTNRIVPTMEEILCLKYLVAP